MSFLRFLTVCACFTTFSSSAIIFGSVITANQMVTIDGKYLPENPPNVPDPRRDLSASYNGNSTGTSQFDFDLADKGIQQGSVFWQSSIDGNGNLKTFSDLRLDHNFGNGPDFTDLDIEMTNTITYGDTVTVRDLSGNQPNPNPTNLYVRFQLQLTGNLFTTATYSDPTISGASIASYYTQAGFSSRIANSSAQANEDVDLAFTQSDIAPGPFGQNVNKSAVLNSNVIFEDLLWNNQAVFIDWNFLELFIIDIEGIDAGSINILMQNDLSNTIVTQASVVDASGNVLPDFQVVSETTGFVYQSIGSSSGGSTPPGTIDEPWSMALFLTGLIVFVRRIKRHQVE